MTFGRISQGMDSAERLAATDARLAEVRCYWDALRRGDQLPKRAQIDPRGIAGALDHVFLLERIAPGMAQLRISGMACNRLFGMEARGLPLSTLFLTEARAILTNCLEQVFATPASLELSFWSERRAGHAPVRGRMILLPLLSHTGQCTMALGCFGLSAESGPHVRFGIGASNLTSFGLPKPKSEDPATALPQMQPVPVSKPHILESATSQTQTTRRSYLRLVHSAT